MKKQLLWTALLGMTLVLLISVTGCGEKSSFPEGDSVIPITSVDQFNKIIETPGRLMVFDLYATWCGPCRRLSPLLEEIAKENKNRADFYKIDVDKNRQLAIHFKVKGIPHVAFLKDKTVIASLTGLQPKGSYVKLIKDNSTPVKQKETKEEIKEGI